MRNKLRVFGAIFATTVMVISALQARRVWLPHGLQFTQSDEVSRLLGTTLPPVTVNALDGTELNIRKHIEGRNTLIILAGMADCLPCASFSLELSVIRNRFPTLLSVIIGSGREEEVFLEYFNRTRIQRYALLDPDRELLRALGVRREPLILLVDDSSRILFVDDRTSSTSSVFRISQLLAALAHSLESSEAL